MKGAALTLFLLAASASGADEATVMGECFTKAGWRVRQDTFSKLKITSILDSSGKPFYAFFFEDAGAGFERDPTNEPNLLSGHCFLENPREPFFSHGYWGELSKLSEELGLKDETYAKLVAEYGKTVRPGLRAVARPQAPRKTPKEDIDRILAAARASDVIYKTFGSKKGDRSVDGLPYDIKVKSSWSLGDFVAMSIVSPEFEAVGYYPFVFRLRGEVIDLVYNWPEDGERLPFSPGFSLVKRLCDAGGFGNIWSDTDENRGQAALWFRARLSKPPSGQVWSPDEMPKVIRVLGTVSKKQEMLLYAKDGSRAVAQYYDEEGEFRLVEMKDGEVSAVLTQEDASERAASTEDRSLYNSYELVCRLGGHPRLITALYTNKKMR